MKLYSLNGTSAVSDGGDEDHDPTIYEADEDGAIEVPPELGERLHGTHIGGVPIWETDGERSVRLVNEEDERRRDPATMLASIEAIRAQMPTGDTLGASERVKLLRVELAEAEAAEKREQEAAAEAQAAAEKAAEDKAAAEKADADAKAKAEKGAADAEAERKAIQDKAEQDAKDAADAEAAEKAKVEKAEVDKAAKDKAAAEKAKK